MRANFSRDHEPLAVAAGGANVGEGRGDYLYRVRCVAMAHYARQGTKREDTMKALRAASPTVADAAHRVSRSAKERKQSPRLFGGFLYWRLQAAAGVFTFKPSSLRTSLSSSPKSSRS